MKLKKAVKILKHHNEWLRGNNDDMVNPTVLGKAIDCVVINFASEKEVLIDFLIFLYDKELINNYDIDFQKEAINYLKSKI